MGFLDEPGLGILWRKIKASFGASLDVSNATITLKSGADTPTNLSQVTIPDATTSTPGVMTAAMVTKLSGIATGATKVTVDGALSATSENPVQNKEVYAALSQKTNDSDLAAVAKSGSYADLSNKPTIPTDYWKTGDSHAKNTVLAAPSGAAGAASFRTLAASDIPSLKASKISDFSTEVSKLISAAQVGAAVFQGTVSANSAISGSAYKKGWYWVVAAAGTYVGQACEVGDMVFAIADKGSAYAAADFSVIQNNIEAMTAAEIEAILV